MASSRQTPSFSKLHSSSAASTKQHRASSTDNTRCEVRLRSALFKRGLRFRKNVRTIEGRPDIVFRAAQVLVFCDGDFWHGKDWESGKERLKDGHNADYWVEKLLANMRRDLKQTEQLEKEGWTVIRYWESDIHQNLDDIAREIEAIVRGHSPETAFRRSTASLKSFNQLWS